MDCDDPPGPVQAAWRPLPAMFATKLTERQDYINFLDGAELKMTDLICRLGFVMRV